MTCNLQDPVWTIDHVAQAFRVHKDRARRYTYLPDFPRPKKAFQSNLWCREAVLEWFRGLPDEPLTEAMQKKQPSSAPVPEPAVQTADQAPAEPKPATSRVKPAKPSRTVKPYKSRR